MAASSTGSASENPIPVSDEVTQFFRESEPDISAPMHHAQARSLLYVLFTEFMVLEFSSLGKYLKRFSEAKEEKCFSGVT